MKKFRVLDLFSGIGGFSLGLERTGGFETVAFCEIEAYPRAVLKKHWPQVPCYGDVKGLTKDRLHGDGIFPNVICGGFPCQDISLAGKGAGLGGERSGLWFEFLRLISEIRPDYVIIENVAAIRSRGLDQVLGSLTSLGYDAEWHCIPASAVGAPHQRDRIWIIAYVMRVGLQGRGETGANATDAPIISERLGLALASAPAFPGEYRGYQPVLGRGVHGVSNRMDRIRALGNAVVPQIPEMIGMAILRAEDAK